MLKCLVAQSCPALYEPIDHSPSGYLVHGDSPGKNPGVGCHALLQGIFLTQGSNPGVLHCRRILYHLSHQGSPRILEWVADPFSRGSSQAMNWTRVSCIAGRFFTSWATREAHCLLKGNLSSISMEEDQIWVGRLHSAPSLGSENVSSWAHYLSCCSSLFLHQLTLHLNIITTFPSCLRKEVQALSSDRFVFTEFTNYLNFLSFEFLIGKIRTIIMLPNT